ncbi:hypothetical protein B3C1_03870 [Gallaecimonas xiamenensis 3-C-1]|uniref:START domain-containing protein n=1 Tax=Gallaecimonas xiamenensis 3-C-1 TaxID=745411 RepID=K2J1B0_9GAMM|nr:hypothetical protein B3C1_03870 [Gallaecimonas xiamenensis 3-C-1]
MGALLLAPLASFAGPWTLKSQQDGISLWTRENPQGLVDIKGQCEVVTRLSAFVAVMEDMASMPKWVAHNAGTRRLAKPSATEDIIHSRFHLPWPAKDRDMVTYSRWSQGEDGVLHLDIEDRGQAYPAEPGYLRMNGVEGHWTLTPQGGGLTEISYQGSADPAGLLPHWLVNRIATRSTRQTLAGLCGRITALDYQDSQYPFVTEPPATRTRSERR